MKFNKKIEKETSNKPSFIYLIFLHLLLLETSLNGVISKFAANQQFLSFKQIVLYGFMILNLGIYAILWQQIIKKIPLITAFSNKAITVIWGMVWGFIIFKESITWNMILGAVIVIAGVIIVVKSDE